MRPDKLEVDNPMYLRDLEARDAAEEGEEVEDAVFSLEEKVRPVRCCFNLSVTGSAAGCHCQCHRILSVVVWIVSNVM